MPFRFPWFRRRRASRLVPRQFRQDEVIFIHVPKCAGSAFLDAYLGYQTGHVTAAEYQAADPHLFDRAFVFSFVRDPLARFVSAYDHVQTDDLWDYLPDMRRAIDRHGQSVSEVAERLTVDSDLLALPWFAPQHRFLEIYGRLAVNRVFKTESFLTDLDVLRAEKSLAFRPLMSVNRRGTGTQSPAERLGPAAVANLRRVYARDFTLFGYY
jgi:hypothetical protein